MKNWNDTEVTLFTQLYFKSYIFRSNLILNANHNLLPKKVKKKFYINISFAGYTWRKN